MSIEAVCHLVDLTTLQTSVSLTMGYLQAFVEADARTAGRYRFSTHCRSFEGDIEPTWADLLRSIRQLPSEKRVFGFTNFFWNRKANVALATRIKSVFPEALIVFGGNDVTNQADRLLTGDSPVDVIVNGEGEVTFANLLSRYLETDTEFQTVCGVSYRTRANEIVTTTPQPRIDDLNCIPSPFLQEVLPAKALRNSLDITYEFSRGCPFRCAFCFWGAAIGTKTRRFSNDRITADLDYIISRGGPVIRIWMADANFGMTDADVETAYILARLVQAYKKKVFLVTNWAKNTTKRVIDAATVLYRHGIITQVTLAAQSLNEEVLRIADRKNIPFEYYRRLQDEFRELGIPTYTDLIFGMPGESYRSFLEGTSRVISAGGTPVIHPLVLLNNTGYNDPAIRDRYAIQSRLMSYWPTRLSGEADILISHDQLPYGDWVKGMALRLVVPLLYCGLLKFIMRQLNTRYSLGYGEMLDRLVEYCMAGKIKSNATFRQIFLSHIEAWKSPISNLPPPSDNPLIKESQFADDAHYRALMKVVLQSPDTARSLITELAVCAADGATDQTADDLVAWIEYQELLIRAMSRAIFGRAEEIQTGMTSAQLDEYAGGHVAEDIGPNRRLRLHPNCRYLSPDGFIFRISYGSIDSLQLFSKREASG